jgi:hypothetical protein
MTSNLSKTTNANPLVVADAPHAPFLYFDNAPTLGHLAGLITITLSAQRVLAGEDGKVVADNVAVAYLRCNIPAARSLRDALDKALLASMPAEQSVGGTARN